METANINDPASFERIYSRTDFEREARLNSQDKTTVQHGIAILSAPDGDGNFSVTRANRHVGEVGESSHSIFIGPSLEAPEYGLFVEGVFQAVRSAHFPPDVPVERLRGFHGG